jgi:plastocyanin
LAVALLVAGTAAGGPVSGKVRLLDKGNAPRTAIQDVLVFIEGVRAEIPESVRSRKTQVASRNKEFAPHVEAVPVGGKIHFPNLDDIMHNVFSLTKGNRFDLGLYKDGAGKDFEFVNPGLVRIYCNIHPQMSAFVHVLENPYFAWAKPDGSFLIENVPAGSYTLKAWHEEGETAKPIVVTEGGASSLLLDVDVSGYTKRPHLNKFGKPYKRDKY